VKEKDSGGAANLPNTVTVSVFGPELDWVKIQSGHRAVTRETDCVGGFVKLCRACGQ